MSKVAISGNASGTGTLTIAAPNTNSNSTLNLPDGSGTFTVNGVNSNIVSSTAQASTSGTSIDFTGIPSWVKRITVMFSGVSTNGSSLLLVRLGTSGGIVTTGYDSTASCGAGVAQYNSSTTGFIITYPAGSASNILQGMVVLCNVTGNTWAESGNISSSVNMLVNSGSSGSVALSGAATTVRITTANGTDTFDAGSINILYE